MDKRVSFRWCWSSINRPYVFLCDPYDGEIIVCVCWGNTYSDPVWGFDVKLSGLVARPFITWAGWQWDRAVARQRAGRDAT